MVIDLEPGLPRRKAAAGCVVAWLHLLNRVTSLELF
jgi:hypothetical protein